MIKSFLAVFLLISLTAPAQLVLPLYDGAIPNNKKVEGAKDAYVDTPIGKIYTSLVTPAITVFLPAKEKATGQAVVICPGGGYFVLAETLEGETIAKKLADNGIAGIVLRYRIPNPTYTDHKETVPLQDVQRALIAVREHARQWNIDPAQVGVMGSSAGGHLASTAGTHFTTCYAPNPNKISVRPDFLVLNYPVISMQDSLTHFGSRYSLIGSGIKPGDLERDLRKPEEGEAIYKADPAPKEFIERFSNERQVTKDTPPTFIIHANDDNVVKVSNSILFIAALQQAGVKVESFFYARGGHGFGIDNPSADKEWIDACIGWITSGRWKSGR